jgi:hypothetical protein
VFIPHEVFTPQKYVHSSTRGSVEGGTPFAGSEGAIPLARGSGGKWAPNRGSGAASPDGGSGRSPQSKIFLVKVYCNFIVNMDRSL